MSRTVLVTGASRGIGRATAIALAPSAAKPTDPGVSMIAKCSPR